MKSAMIFAVLAVSVFQLVVANPDGYSSAPTVTYTYDVSSGYSGAITLVGSLCSGVIKNLGVPGCRNLLEGVVQGISGGSAVFCVQACQTYLDEAIAALAAQGYVSVSGGAVVLVKASASITTALGGLVGGLIGGLLGALIKSLQVIVGGIVNGLICGIGAAVDAALVGVLNIVKGLVVKVTGVIKCIASSCLQIGG